MNRYQFNAKKHLHTLDGKALTGTSSVSSVIAKPLTWWASGLAVKELGVPDPKVLTKLKRNAATKDEKETHFRAIAKRLAQIKEMEPAEYADVLDAAYRAHQTTLDQKADQGTDLHEELERFVKNTMANRLPTPMYDPRIQPFIDWAIKNVKQFLWSEMHCYSEKHWLGGISDCGYISNDGKLGIIDFKSSKEAYLTQFWQCAGYDLQISENGGFTADGDKVFELPQPIDHYVIFAFGAPKVLPAINVDVAGCKEAFLAMVLLYKKLPRD